MARGVSKSSPVQSFIGQVEALISQIENTSKAVLEDGKGSEWTLGDKTNWTGDVTNPSEVKKAFIRSDVKDIINTAMDPNDPGTIADMAAMQFQNDYVCSMERAFLTRHSNSIRSEVFAAGRRKLLAQANMRYATEETLSDMIERGKSRNAI
jgi:hypothetical protein